MQTLCRVFESTARERADHVALRTLEGRETTWGRGRSQVHRLAGGLRTFGIERGATLAMMMVNRPEFLLVDMATLIAGGTPVSIYATSPPDEIAYILDDAAVRVIVVERRFEAALRDGVRRARVHPRIVVLDDAGAEGLRSVADACPAGFDGAAAGDEVQVADVAALVYTSGTTGQPKGVQLTHGNFHAAWRACCSLDPRIEGLERVISYLPAAHVADRLWGYVVPLHAGASITYASDPKQVGRAMATVRPSFFVGVPRIWEKLRVALMSSVPEGRAIDEPQIAADLRAMVGLDADVVTLSGAAPLAAEVLDFFDRIGVSILEGYGMTETSGIISATRLNGRKIGSVGQPLDGVAVRLAPDGEVLVRGDNVTPGYRNKPGETADAIDPDGWLYTGDIGEIDDEGMITIVDRKKELIITAGGKNLSPANIENAIRSATHLAGPVLAVGDRRPYVTAIISLDPDETRAWGQAHGFGDLDLAELSQLPGLRDAITAAVEQANSTLSRASQVKRFVIVPNVWDPTTAFITPTMKLKRKAATEHYAGEIERLYTQHEGSVTPDSTPALRSDGTLRAPVRSSEEGAR